MLIGSLSEKADEADVKARTAITDSSTALSQAKEAVTKAGIAQDSLGRAEDEANGAKAAASNALTLASGARQEADSFERDIVAAKKQAADAESHLAEALKRAADASAELDRIKSPRSLTNASELVNILKRFSGTEFMFASVFSDDESIQLLKQINNVLEGAAWKRLKHSEMNLGIPAIQLTGRDDLVNTDVSTGVHIEVDSPETVETLTSLPRDQLPSHVMIAILLKKRYIRISLRRRFLSQKTVLV
jgi:hypothetical protein